MSDFAEDTNVPTNDCINRQAAIDAALGAIFYDEYLTEQVNKAIDALPSADSITEEDYTELRDRFGEYVEFVVRDMISGKGERWTKINE